MVCYPKMCIEIAFEKERIIRMANSFKIGNVIPRLFNGSKYEDATSRTSNPIIKEGTYNPFKNSSIKVDVLTADVFDTTSFTGAGNTATSVSKIKRMASAFVGSINNIGEAFNRSIDSITAAFGKVRDSVTGAWNYLNETRVPGIVEMGKAIKTKWETNNYNKEVKRYAAKPVAELRDMLTETLTTAA